MSLVAYGASSDEESDYGEEGGFTSNEMTAAIHQKSTVDSVTNEVAQISDDEDYIFEEASLAERKPTSLTLLLPKPINVSSITETVEDDVEQQVTPAFAKLPMPKSNKSSIAKNIVVEEDDEFLHKKAVPLENNQSANLVSSAASTKGPVKIKIPSLKDFSDVDQEVAEKMKNKNIAMKKTGSGLLNLLPIAKSEQNFAKASAKSDFGKDAQSSRTANLSPKRTFVPDSVKNRRPAMNTENIDGMKSTSMKGQSNVAMPKTLIDCSESDASDEEGSDSSGGDFFSLNTSNKLPEVSTNEINAFVAQRAAKMAEARNKFMSVTEMQETKEIDPSQIDEHELRQSQKRFHEKQLNDEAVEALVGSSAKRRRKQHQDIQVVDISSDQVLPDREEWMRTALASSTTYQPTGVLVDEEPVAGTRRKHQITYLAHRAKANEAELQAMWSANRHNRRATQSKYGF